MTWTTPVAELLDELFKDVAERGEMKKDELDGVKVKVSGVARNVRGLADLVRDGTLEKDLTGAKVITSDARKIVKALVAFDPTLIPST